MSVNPWKTCFTALLVFAVTAPLQARADGEVDLPPVTVYGTAITTEGDPVFCFSASCNQIIQFETSSFDGTFSQMSQEGAVVDKETFCNNLAGNQPPGCSYSHPPAVPGFTPGWMGNGCGDGSFAAIFADQLVGHLINGYDGDLDHPFPGVSFYPACQMHDKCYATGGKTKSYCDGVFGTNLDSICRATGGSYATSCGQLGDLYVDAVKTFGGSNYNAGQAEYACAAWVSEMEVNECPYSS